MRSGLEYLKKKLKQNLDTVVGPKMLGHYKKSSKPEADLGKQVYGKYDHLINYYEHMSHDDLSVALGSQEPSNRYPPLT